METYKTYTDMLQNFSMHTLTHCINIKPIMIPYQANSPINRSEKLCILCLLKIEPENNKNGFTKEVISEAEEKRSHHLNF